MNKTEKIKEIIQMYEADGYYDMTQLPEGISKEVISKLLMQLEYKKLIQTGGDEARIEELKNILYPAVEEEL